MIWQFYACVSSRGMNLHVNGAFGLRTRFRGLKRPEKLIFSVGDRNVVTHESVGRMIIEVKTFLVLGEIFRFLREIRRFFGKFEVFKVFFQKHTKF